MKMNIDNKIQRNISQNKIVNNSIESKNIRISEPNKDVFIKFSNNQKNDNNDKKHNTFKKITIAALAIGAISTLAAFIVHKKVKKNKNISDEIFITPEQRKNFEELTQQIPALNKITDDIDKVFYLKHIIPKVENLITDGLNWELRNEELDITTRIGTRNFAKKDVVKISYKAGDLLIFIGK